MKKDILTVLKKLTVIATAAVLLICLSACGKKESKGGGQKTFIDVLDDGSVVANFDKTEKGTGGGSGITIEEGEYLIIETALTEGGVQVRVVRGGSDIDALPTKETDTPATIDSVFEGSGTTEYLEIKPGNYMFNVMVEEKATGTITASKKPLSDN